MIQNYRHLLTGCLAVFFICCANFDSKRLIVSLVEAPWKSFGSMFASLLLLVFVEVMSINEPGNSKEKQIFIKNPKVYFFSSEALLCFKVTSNERKAAKLEQIPLYKM